jgi:hypothetical protein
MKAALTALLGSLVLGTTGCSLQIDQIFEMKEGSAVDVYWVMQGSDQQVETLLDQITFEGGVVMRINTSTTLVDYLDGTVDGDVEILDLLFGIPNLQFVFTATGPICVVLDDPPGGGTFAYDVLAQQAAFDVLVNTKAVITNPNFAQLVVGGAFQFPFDLQASIPLTLVDALGLFTGTGSLEVTQALDAIYTIPLYQNGPGSNVFPFKVHILGNVTLSSTDTFPAPPIVLDCLDFLGT